MEVRQLFQDVPGGRNKFHSAILTTYSFNFHHFEYQVLKTLQHKWVINVGVLVDANRLDDVLGISSGGLKKMTKSYSINGIASKGAFHPKLNFLVGDKQMLLMLGSGNLTPGGQGKNHQSFGVLYAENNESKMVPLLNEAYQYLKLIGKDLDDYSARRINKSLPDNCNILGETPDQKHLLYPIDDKIELALLYNDSTSIQKQLLDLIPSHRINRIRILSPYYDKNGALLTQFLEVFPNATIEVYLPIEKGLPPNEFTENKRVKFYRWEETKRGKVGLSSPDNYNRKLHSKLFLFETDELSYFMLGSANATIAAFGTESSRGINDEFNLLYKTGKRDFFKELGIHGPKKVIQPSELVRESVIIESSPEKEKKASRIAIIRSCDLDKHTLKGSVKTKENPLICLIILCDGMGKKLHESKISIVDKFKIQLPVDIANQDIAYIQLEDEISKSILSNKQVVNSIDNMFETDPSFENRTIRGIRNGLELGKLNEYQLMEYLNIIHKDEKATVYNSSNSQVIKAKDISPTMTYAEAMEASKNKELKDLATSQHSSVQFWQAINNVLKLRYETVQNTLADEEEDGEATQSNDRQDEKEEKRSSIDTSDIADFNRVINKSQTLANNYAKAIQFSKHDTELELNEIVFCQFLLVSHILSTIHHFNHYDFPKDKKGKYTAYSPERWSKINKGHYSTWMRLILIQFAQLCLSHKIANLNDDIYRQDKLNEYKEDALVCILLNHFLINHNGIMNAGMESTDLACLTVYRAIGFPSEKAIERLEYLSESETESLFDTSHLVKLLKRLEGINEKIDKKEGYFFYPKYGVCLIHEEINSKIRYKTIIDITQSYEMKLSVFKKL